ncbi:unnamed protein product [Vitrella brassicaformis CCMP3155]|uniref:Uncharacterized protein n=2 Tax=Vitrella brassicaformis TaxID=1169539 RepID=A0A0G4GJV4_VITBC|nr:unnamed protein product [Vitrella brassicaformis CCMP3155]|eukprot:CEM30231.1 unnamed protein product [Vitrella brassicaformis CCMP3155]
MSAKEEPKSSSAAEEEAKEESEKGKEEDKPKEKPRPKTPPKKKFEQPKPELVDWQHYISWKVIGTPGSKTRTLQN